MKKWHSDVRQLSYLQTQDTVVNLLLKLVTKTLPAKPEISQEIRASNLTPFYFSFHNDPDKLLSKCSRLEQNELFNSNHELQTLMELTVL